MVILEVKDSYDPSMRFYNPSAFRSDDLDEVLNLIEQNPLATLITSKEGETFVSHLPMVAKREGDKVMLNSHFSKANPHLAICREVPSVYLVFHGVSASVTPTLYLEKGVPTWNYSVVHLRGKLSFVSQENFDSALEAMTRHFESKRGSEYTSTSADDYIRSMKRGIEVIEIEVTEVEGKFKLSQNRQLEDRIAVAKSLNQSVELEDKRTAAEMARVNHFDLN